MKKTICSCLIFCGSALAEPVEVIPPEQKMLSGSGRFVFGQISSYRSDQYLIDTETGRVWNLVQDDQKAKVLQPIPFSAFFGPATSVTPISTEYETKALNKGFMNAIEQIKSENKEK